MTKMYHYNTIVKALNLVQKKKEVFVTDFSANSQSDAAKILIDSSTKRR